MDLLLFRHFGGCDHDEDYGKPGRYLYVETEYRVGGFGNRN